MDGFFLGIALVICAGALEGLFSLGVTRTPKWKWEHIWGLGSLIALVVVPWPLAILTVKDLAAVYGQVQPGLLVLTFLFGVGWGLGGIFWGKAIAVVGMALGVSLLMGFITIFGSLGPLAVNQPGKFVTPGGATLVGAVAIMICGVACVSAAGRIKERELSAGSAREGGTRASKSFMVGLVFCVLSGLLSAFVNFGFIHGAEIAEAAAERGTSIWAKGFPIWAIVFTGNYLVNFLYALWLMIRNRNITVIFSPADPIYWFWALFMGLAWPAGIVVYGVAAYKMGDYGAYAGFPMMLLCSILFGNLAGAVTGEWRGTSGKPKRVMALGVFVLFAAFAVLGLANKLLTTG